MFWNSNFVSFGTSDFSFLYGGVVWYGLSSVFSFLYLWVMTKERVACSQQPACMVLPNFLATILGVVL